ncbi:hypothetical protein SLEP1_g8755 [Rubroshorea leprosula]|uniref:BHLH domain-containing protein n=1 Tax=Rubroshorea leprosula TaxID=152421 RepID=A0AAV5I2Q0_9ROSI|nr:hypothetical protein SLEP1_g8755 [Rubroshorea leprosula]
MDYVSSMFSFDQNTDDLFETFSFPNFQPDELLQVLSEDTDLLINKTNNWGGSGGRRRKAPETASGTNKDENPGDNKKKKIIHRDLERQRRQEMTTLYGTLRSLLPPEYLKGKRSMSDHMNQAVKYIKDMQNRIGEFSEKRDELKRLSNSCSSTSFAPPKCLRGCPEDTVIVRPCMGASVEVVISTAMRQGLPLSSVLQALIAEGLSIFNCISTKVDQMLLHTIVSEASDGRVIDPSELQQKLEDLTLHSPRVDFDFDVANGS